MRYNPARQEVILKVVYYGPGLAGKTSNLQFLQRRAPAGSASQLVSVDTHSERTLQFDFLAAELGKVQGFDIRLDFATVPGQSYYAATRREVLTGVDGVVFVADSRREALDENIDAMNEMLSNLRHHGLPDDLPVVMQYNKQDLPTAVPPDQLQPLLNVRGWPSFAAVAATGEGVAETCEALARMLMERLSRSELPLLVSPGAPRPTYGTPAPVTPPKSWLISCFRCQSMLDVPSAAIGEIYTCGVCQTSLEILDPDRGTTRLPQGAARPVTGQHGRSRPSASIDEDLYQAYEQPAGNGALKPATSQHQRGGSGSGAGTGTGSIPRSATGSFVRGGLAPAGEFPLPGFTVLGILDENAQARRLRVRETATGKTFRAVVLAPSLLDQPGYRESVESYTRMTGPIRHPNLLALASFRQANDEMVFLSADPQDHESLAHVLSRRRALAPPHALGILRQIVLALEEGARHGAIHGWLRPDAVLVNAEGTVLLDELCIPPCHRYLTRELAGVSAATEYYLAPEYLNDELRGDIRSDIFLLGALLFRMLTGEGLVTGYTAMEALHKITANGPRMLRDAQPNISRELNNFFLRLVAVDRNQRYQTYGEVLDALDRFGGGAKRQNLQLTAPQPRSSTQSRSASGGVQVGRRGGTGPLPPVPRTTRISRDPSGGQPVLPPPRRQKPSSAPFIIVVVVMLALAGVVFMVVMMQPPHGSGFSAETPTPPPPMATRPDPVPPRPVVPPTPATRPSTDPTAGGAVGDQNRERAELRRQLSDQLVAEQYAAALKTSERFADPVEKRDSQAQVLAQHDSRKQDIEALLKPGVNPTALAKMLEPARTTWGLPGDLNWALAVKSRADAQALGDQSVAQQTAQQAGQPVKPTDPPAQHPEGDLGPTPLTPLVPVMPVLPVAPTNDPMAGTAAALKPPTAELKPLPKPEIPPVADPTSAAFTGVVRALAANQPAQAQTAVSGLDQADPSAVALSRMISWWPARIQLLNRVAGTKAVKLRFNHPTTGDLVDLNAADAAGMTVTSANGSSSSLTWGQVPLKSQAKLAADAAGVPGATADELGGAAALQLVADEPVFASVIARRGKAVLGDKVDSIDRLVELSGRRAAVAILNKGFEAARGGNLKGAADALAEARKLDKAAFKGLDGELTRLEQASLEPAAPVSQVPVTAGQQMPDPGLPKDLKERQAALRTLGWEPVGGAWLDGTSVQLMPNAGISYEVTKAVGGFVIEAKGTGYLRLIPTRGTVGSSATKGGIPLPLNDERPGNYTVNFTRDGMTVLDGRGLVIQTLPLSAPPTLFLIISTADATLITVPKPIIQ